MISKVISDQFIETMSKYGFQKNAFCPAYGMTEATIFVSYNNSDDEYEWVSIDRNSVEVGKEIKYQNDNENDSSIFVNVGNILDIVKVRIVADDNSVLEDEKIGHIHLKGNCVISEYYQDPISTNAAFTEDRWFITGDMGFIKENNLFITGRYKDMIICNGKNYYADDLEHITSSIPEVVNSIAFGVFDQQKMEEKIIFYIEKDKLAEEESTIRKIRTLLGLKSGLYIDEIHFTDTIPKTKTGKKRRNYLKNEYLKSKKYNSTLVQNDEKILSKGNEPVEIELSQIWMKVLDQDNINDDINFFELGGNSIKAIQLIEEINRKLQMKLKVKSIFKNPVFTDFQKYVKKLE
jgi:acyl-CoA synthetase (AMP-forming)/AMP-acid ligase II/acyl carrier protein